MLKFRYIAIGFIILSGFLYFIFSYDSQIKITYQVGQPIDSLNGVYVYYNGEIRNVHGRNRASNGYNFGLKYQCVEFVKRYYYQYLNHSMPDTYGHARDFYNPALNDGQLNNRRGLTQYSNPSIVKPEVNDLVVFSGSRYNRFGHVAIISKVEDDQVEIIQQNSGYLNYTRQNFRVKELQDKWLIDAPGMVGWLRK